MNIISRVASGFLIVLVVLGGLTLAALVGVCITVILGFMAFWPPFIFYVAAFVALCYTLGVVVEK